MLRKHINDSASVVSISSSDIVGPCACPQVGCQREDGEYPFSRGCVVFQEFGGYSGDYLTSEPCRCCDGKGHLFENERPYFRYCFGVPTRDILTPYPNPHPMPQSVYEDPRLLERLRNRREASPPAEEKKTDCFIATAIYGDSSMEVDALRWLRDNHIRNYILGRAFIRIYYRASPPLASWLRHHKTSAELVRSVLTALVGVVSKLRK